MKAGDRMKTRYDIRSNSVDFEEGDQVWLYNPKRGYTGLKSHIEKLGENTKYVHCA